ncbi:MAG: type II toxin-antitoxin system VapB family antitoxin [Myxacorys californica WJT36-NPBG1]|nr:type II toxin-antitoxin system VapB family antitoxin [Myxacorys californica WJT36-NPBG1]
MAKLEIDNTLIQEALALGKHQTEQAVIEAALQEYVQRRKQVQLLELFGAIDYDPNYDYKQQGLACLPCVLRGKTVDILHVISSELHSLVRALWL